MAIFNGGYDTVEYRSRIVVTVESGAVVRITKGSVTREAVSNGTAAFLWLESGTWTVSATKNGETVTKSVSLGKLHTVSVTLTFPIPISTVPSQSGSLTYNGQNQTPVWSGYNAAQLTLGGTTSGTNAGTYNATFTPKAGYKWADGSTGAKSVSWSIGKAAGSLSINPTSLSFDSLGQSKTIAVTRAGNGAITATSGDTKVATVSVSGTTVTVKSVANGSAIITVKVAAGTNHNAPGNKTCAVTVDSRVWLLRDGVDSPALTGGWSPAPSGGKITQAGIMEGDRGYYAHAYSKNKVDLTKHKIFAFC